MAVRGVAFFHSVVDEKMAVGHATYSAHLVAHQQDSGALRQLLDDVVEALLEMIVKIAQRLVQYKDFGTADDSTSE